MYQVTSEKNLLNINMHQDKPVNDICWKFITFLFCINHNFRICIYTYPPFIHVDNRTQLDNQTTLVQNQGCHT